MEINGYRSFPSTLHSSSSSSSASPSAAPSHPGGNVAARTTSNPGVFEASSFTPAPSGPSALLATTAASGVATATAIEAPPPPVQQEPPKPVRRKRRKRRGLLGKLKRAFRKLGRGLKKMARGIKNVVKSAFKGVASLGKGLFKGFKALVRGDIKGAFKAVTQGIKDTVHHAFQALREALPLVTKLIPGVAVLLAAVPKLDKLVTNLQQGFVDSMASIAKGALNTTTRFVEGALDGASALARGDIKGAFKAVAQGTRDSLKTGWKTFNEALPYLVTAACFVPGLNVVAIPLRVGMAARDLALAIKNKDALGIVGAVADGVAGGAAGRGLKLVTRAADMVGNGVSVAYGAQAAARGDTLGAVAGLAGGAAGARGRVGEAAGQLSMGASFAQSASMGDSAGAFQTAGGLAAARRGPPSPAPAARSSRPVGVQEAPPPQPRSQPLTRAAGGQGVSVPRTGEAPPQVSSTARAAPVQQAAKDSKYDRFWDLHLTHDNGFYDFTDNIREQLDHQGNKPKLSDKRVLIDNLEQSTGPGHLNARPLQGVLPTKGVVASMVSLKDVLDCKVTPEAQQLVKWINASGQQGKLRINSHGDGMGQLGMKDGQGGWRWVDSKAVVDWLRANGLEASGSGSGSQSARRQEGLSTINVAACMAARSGTTPATYDPTTRQSTSAKDSAVDSILKQLSKQQLNGIEVTGSNEITISGNGSMSRVLGVSMDQAPSSWEIDRRMFSGVEKDCIRIPDGWAVEKVGSGWQVHIPSDYKIRADQQHNRQEEPSGGWTLVHKDTTLAQDQREVTVPGGWILDPSHRVIKAPLGWEVNTQNVRNKERHYLAPAHGNRLTEAMTHSPYKVRDLS